MVICPTCKAHNDSKDHRCSVCGGNLAGARLRVCPNCGTPNLLCDLYCIQCLQLLPAAELETAAFLKDSSSADLTPDPLAMVTQGLPEARLDFSPAQTHDPEDSAQPLPPIPAESRLPALLQLPCGLRLILVLLLLGACLMPMVWRDDPQALADQAVAEVLEPIAPNSTVLVAIEYGPAYAGELQPMAEALLDGLTERGTVSVLVTSHPLGMANLERLAAGHEGAVNLGYVLGGALGLRLMYGQPSGCMPPAASRAPLGQMVVIAQSPVGVQRWLEQVQSTQRMQVLALVSAQAELALEPYRASSQLSRLYSPASLALQEPVQTAQTGWGVGLGMLLVVIVAGAVSICLLARRRGAL
ncbi:MAG: hypothetical protein GXY52_04435 [Chloroflexi bacterium]|nr:hypothetical protein [Chloroflexota bacterium]